MAKKLVAYFSASGVTAKVADMLADAIGADIHEISPKVPYTKADLNWMNKKSRSSIEMNDKTIRPEIAESNVQIEDYEVMFLGFPIWWFVAPHYHQYLPRDVRLLRPEDHPVRYFRW